MNQPSFNPSDPNYLSDLLTHLSSVSDPNYQANENAYNQATGLDVNGRYQAYNAARYLLPAVYQQLAGQLGYYNSLQPMAQQSTSALLSQLSNPDSMAQQYQNQAQAQSQSTLQNVLQRLRSSGAGIGASQGAAIDANNQAASAGNQFRAQQDSSAGRAQRLNSILGLIAGQSPNYGNLGMLGSIETGTPRNQTGLQAIGQLASSFGGFLPGGGSKSSTGSSAYGNPIMANGSTQGPDGTWYPPTY